jgi:hypothetical protein
VTEERETEAETRNDKETMKRRKIIWHRTGNVNSERKSAKECARYYGDGGNQRNSIASLVLVSCSFASGLRAASVVKKENKQKTKKSRRRKMCVCPSASLFVVGSADGAIVIDCTTAAADAFQQ